MANEYSPEIKARHKKINPKLVSAGWDIQNYKTANVYSSKGVAVEYFQMAKEVGEADYVLFVNGIAVGVIEAKKEFGNKPTNAQVNMVSNRRMGETLKPFFLNTKFFEGLLEIKNKQKLLWTRLRLKCQKKI